MKLFFALLTILTFNTFNLLAQWQPDFRLTNAPLPSYTSSNNTWCVAASGNVVHVVWQDYRDGGNGEIYYKRSTDGGVSWGTDTRFTNDPAESSIPSVAVSGQLVIVLWKDYRQSAPEIYYKRSTDGGVTWSADIPLTIYPPAFIDYPCVTISGQNVHVVWADIRNTGGNNEIYYKSSTDGGVTWSADTRLTNDPANQTYPSVSVSGQVVHVAWMDFRDGPSGNDEIYYKRSTDGGITWGVDKRLTIDSAISSYPSIAVSGSVVHVVWYETRDGSNGEIYYKRSTDGGVSWGADTRLTNDPAVSIYPSVSSSGSNVHVVWKDTRDGNNGEIYYKRSTDGGISWGADVRLTNSPSVSEWPSVAVSGSSVHVVWFDLRDGNAEIYYKRDPTGNPSGIININSEIPGSFSLSQNYPNPFNPNSKIKFQIAKLSTAKMVVFDVLGREIETLVNEQLKPGTYEVDFDGSRLSSGIYYYKLETKDFTSTKKMILLK